jgi:hypothetical protein
MESYLISFLHDTAVGSVAGHCGWSAGWSAGCLDKSSNNYSVSQRHLHVAGCCGCAKECCVQQQDDSE